MPTNVPRLVLIWKGVNSPTLWRTEPTDLTQPFPGQQVVPNVGPGTLTRVALIALGNQILMAFLVSDGTDIYYSFFNNPDDPANWDGLHDIPGGANSSWGPALAPLGNGAVMLWNGAGSDTRIWMSRYTPAPPGKEIWTPQALTKLPNGAPIQTGSGPAVVNWNGQLLMVWRGEGSNDNLYFAFSSDGQHWGAQAQIPGAASTNAPALTVFNGLPFLAFKGGVGDDGMYGAIYSPATGRWATEPNSTGVFPLGSMGTSHGPSLAVWNGKLFMAWKGNPGDTDMYWAQSSTGGTGSWTGQSVISNTGSDVGPAVVAYVGPELS